MTSKWTAKDIPDLSDKIAIVTGANSGIGYEIARALSNKNAKVILACRNKENGEAAVRQIVLAYPEAQVELMQIDLSDLSSVQHFSGKFTNHYDRLDILINNAGIMRPPFGKTTDGFELQFGINHLGHFALTGLLLPLIINTSNARIITISSGGERFSKIDLDNLNAEKGYDPGKAYGQSKLANLFFTYELERRFRTTGINAIAAAAHPGWTKNTKLPLHWPMVRILNPIIGQKPTIGALPALYAATVQDVEGGAFYGPDGWLGLRGYPTKVKSSNSTCDTDIAAKLWTLSENLTGIIYQWPNKKMN